MKRFTSIKIYLNRTHISKLTMIEVDGHIISQELQKG